MTEPAPLAYPRAHSRSPPDLAETPNLVEMPDPAEMPVPPSLADLHPEQLAEMHPEQLAELHTELFAEMLARRMQALPVLPSRDALLALSDRDLPHHRRPLST